MSGGWAKTTLARQLTRRLREQGKPVAFVSAEPASDAADALASIREQLATADGIPEALQQAASTPAASARPADLARSLAVTAPQPTVVIVDGIDAGSGHELFGRLRELLWQAPVSWVVTARDRGLLAPPADSFFEQVTELSPLAVDQVDELLKRRLGADARKLPVHEIALASEGNPRRALELTREVAIDRQGLASVLEQRAVRESRVSELPRRKREDVLDHPPGRTGVGMSAKAIERLAETGAFEPSEGFSELSEHHVDFDQLVGGKKREAALGKLLQRSAPVTVAVRGPSGSGKSSMIAGTLADLYSHLPLPIAIASADIGILESQTLFGQFIIREINRQAKTKFAAQARPC